MLFLISNREMEKKKMRLIDLVKKSWDTERAQFVSRKDRLPRVHKPNFSIQTENKKTFIQTNGYDNEKSGNLNRKKDVGKGNKKEDLRSYSEIEVGFSETLGKNFEKPLKKPLNFFARKQSYSMKSLLIRFNNKVLNEKKEILKHFKSKKIIDSRKLNGEDKVKMKKKENLEIFILSQSNPKFHLNNF